MRDDVPAALPLISFAAGLALAPLLVNPPFAVPALLLVSLLSLATQPTRRARITLVSLFFTAGLMLARHTIDVRDRELRMLARFDSERFVTIEAPLDHDWSVHGASHVLRVARFHANGIAFAQELALFARFTPPPIAMHARIRAAVFLRRDERGELSATIKSPRLMTLEGALPWWSLARLNRLAAMRLEPFARDRPVGVALAETLALGRSERLTAEIRASYRRGGTYHLLVFSGLQIALAAALLTLLLRRFRRPRLADWSLLLFAAAAPAFIGPTAPVSRAAIAIGLYAVSRILKRPTSFENLFCIAALVRLICFPDDLHEVAFQLTYAGAGALLFVGKPLARVWPFGTSGKPRRLRRAFACGLAAELAVTSLTLFHFHQYALAGSLLMLALTPVFVAMLAVAATLCIVPCDPLLAIMEKLHALCEQLNDSVGVHLRMSGFFAAPPASVLIVGFTAAALAMALLHGRRRVITIVLALLVPLGGAFARDRAGRVVATPRLIALDVGQGDSLLLRDGAHNVLVDGGGRNDDATFGESVLLPLLVDRGVRHLDAIVLTHAHPDHCGGLPAAITQLGTREVWLSPRRLRGDCAVRMLEACLNSETPIHIVRDGDVATVGAFRLQALLADRTFKHAPENNSSVVLRVQSERRRLLLTGDVERDAEAALVARRINLRADILKVGHHGSRTSSTSGLLDAVSPRLALISCGRHNLFGHPHPSVLASLQARAIRVRRTDRNGSVDVVMRDGHLFILPEIDTEDSQVLELADPHVLDPPPSRPLDRRARPGDVRPP